MRWNHFSIFVDLVSHLPVSHWSEYSCCECSEAVVQVISYLERARLFSIDYYGQIGYIVLDLHSEIWATVDKTSADHPVPFGTLPFFVLVHYSMTRLSLQGCLLDGCRKKPEHSLSLSTGQPPISLLLGKQYDSPNLAVFISLGYLSSCHSQSSP